MLGLKGITLELTSGSDKDGTPMRGDLEGSMRRKALLTKSVGFRGGKVKKVHGKKKYLIIKGMRKRKYIRGNTVSEDIAQINCKIVEGEGDVPLMLGIKKEEVSTETPTEEVKEKSEEPKKETKEEVSIESKPEKKEGE